MSYNCSVNCHTLSAVSFTLSPIMRGNSLWKFQLCTAWPESLAPWGLTSHGFVEASEAQYFKWSKPFSLLNIILYFIKTKHHQRCLVPDKVANQASISKNQIPTSTLLVPHLVIYLQSGGDQQQNCSSQWSSLVHTFGSPWKSDLFIRQ